PIRAPEPITVGEAAFLDRAALMAELDGQRAFAHARERAQALESRRRTLLDRRTLLASLLEDRTQEDWDRAAQAAAAADAVPAGPGADPVDAIPASPNAAAVDTPGAAQDDRE